MVLFGELVLPSSRILWDDDEYEQFQTDSETIQWQGEANVPTEITNLLVIETKKLTNLATSCLEENNEPLCKLAEAGVTIHKLKDNNYLVLCTEVPDVIPGEVTEKLIPWIKNAKNVTAITSNASAMFHKTTREDMPSSFIRALSTGNPGVLQAPRLEAPNLVTGITAGVLSYCQHTDKSAVLYVNYLDSTSLDSTTAGPVLTLLRKLAVPSIKPFVYKPLFKDNSNLYM